MQSSTIVTPLRSRSPLLVLAPLGLLVIFIGLGADGLHQIKKGNVGGFNTYYDTAEALRDGRDPYVPKKGTYAYIYPPLFAWLCRPILSLPRANAARWMFFLDLTFLLAALLLISREMLSRFAKPRDPPRVALVALITAIVCIVPIHNELRGLESNTLVLLSFVLGLYWLDRHPLGAGLALAVAINIKYLPVLMVPYMLLRRRWLAAMATVVWTVILGLLPAITLGWTTNVQYLRVAVGGLLHLTGKSSAGAAARVPDITQDTSLSVTSGLARFASTMGWSKGVGLAMALLVAAICGGLLLRAYRKRRMPLWPWPGPQDQRVWPYQGLVALEWAGIVAVALAFSPNTQDRHLVLAVIPSAMAVMLLLVQQPGVKRARAGWGIALMVVALFLPLSVMSRSMSISWRAAALPTWFLLASYMVLAGAALSDLASRADEVKRADLGE
jgi:hypothetical protein